MYLFFSLIALAVGWYFDPGQISEIPFSELTLGKVSRFVFSFGFYGLTFYLVMRSLDEDRIWPWRWTLPYFGNLLLRVALITLIVAFPFLIASKEPVTDLKFLMTLLAILGSITFVVFSPALNIFKEKTPTVD